MWNEKEAGKRKQADLSSFIEYLQKKIVQKEALKGKFKVLEMIFGGFLFEALLFILKLIEQARNKKGELISKIKSVKAHFIV